MRPHCIVVASPGFDDYLGFASTAEPLDAQALVTESAVEALVHAVLPRFAGVDQGGLDAGALQPLENGVAEEFRPVVGTQIAWCAVLTHETRQHFDDTSRPDAAGDVDRQTFAGELIDDRQAFEAPSIGAGVEHEVVGPDVIRRVRRNRPRARVGYTSAAAPRGQLEGGELPQAVRAMPTHPETFTPEEDSNPTISVARILRGQSLHRLQSRRVALGAHRPVPQRRSCHFEQLASASLRQAAFTRKSHLLSTRLRAHHFRRLISLKVSISRSRSASMRFSFAFSDSSARSRLTSTGSNVPK